MIEQTIHDAAERVETLPVKAVFNWKRLRLRFLFVGLLTVFAYVLVLAGFVLASAVFRRENPVAGVYRFHNVVAIWFERNILLRNTIWLRNAHLELVVPPAGGDLRIGRDVRRSRSACGRSNGSSPIAKPVKAGEP